MNDRALLDLIRPVTGSETCSDDCAILPLSCGILVSSTDMLHHQSDFPEGITDYQIGWMSVAVTISDIAAMGGDPLQILLAIGLDREDRLPGIVRGAQACCARYGAVYAGGDLDAHPELTIVSTGIGIIKDGEPVRRAGANPGDLICVTGVLGRAILGLDGDMRFWKNLCEPEPRVDEGRAARKAGATAMMDISDGLALSLYDIANESKTGMEIESQKLPLPADADRESAFDAAMYGGGDFELLFCIPKEKYGSLPFPSAIIGTVTIGPDILMDRELIRKRGYLHHW